MFSIARNPNRLELHDSTLEHIERHGDILLLEFDWAKLESFEEGGVMEGIVLGRTRLFVAGVTGEQLKIYEGDVVDPVLYEKAFDLAVYPSFLVGTSNLESERFSICGFPYDKASQWIEWTLNFNCCTVKWNHFVRHSDWLQSKLPKDD